MIVPTDVPGAGPDDVDAPGAPAPGTRPDADTAGPTAAIVESGAPERGGTLAARVARDIEAEVRRAGWPVGRVLGSETELRGRYRISRAVLREAVRLVEHHQVASMRRGPAGGLIVRAPDAGAATNAVVVYLEFVGSTIEHVLDARRRIEPLVAALAAERITEDQTGVLRESLREEMSAGPSRDSRARTQLHLTLAEMSGNPAMHLFVDVLLRLTRRYAHDQLTHLPPNPLHPALTSSDDSHEELVDAVVSGDAPRAQLAQADHLAMFEEFLLTWRHDRRSPGPLWEVPPSGHTQDQKLAEVVAQKLFADVQAAGWRVGSVIGSEALLLDRFGVSRAVLREAVRLLEYHSVARMRRGPGGGLVVTEPDPTASIDAMALYLDFQGIETHHLRTVRQVVELACLDQVARRIHEPEVARRLREMGRAEAPANPFERSVPGAGELDAGRAVELGKRSHLLHMELAELAGNPVLALFLRILITLWAQRNALADGAPTAPATPAPPAPDPLVGPAPTAEDTHQRIVDALLSGDSALARHRMRRHLGVLTEWWQ